MDRRNFFRILSATSAGALTTGCGHKGEKLMPLLVPEHEIVPGEEQWHAAAGFIAKFASGKGGAQRNFVQVREAKR